MDTTQALVVPAAALVAGALITAALHVPAIRRIEQAAAAEVRRVEAWYAAHTTPAERALVDEVARAGVAALEARVGIVEGKVAAVPPAPVAAPTPPTQG